MTATKVQPDPLQAMLAHGGFSRSDVEPVLVRWLAQEFLDDQYAQLDSIGVSADAKVRLARVFVDLAEEGQEDVAHTPGPREAFPDTPPPPGVLAALLAEPAARPLAETASQTGFPRPVSDPRHTLVIGGPGQGKTTLVQYLCQIHRACILDRRRAGLDDHQCLALDELRARCARDGLTRQTQPRVPLFVVLRDFAAWLARHPTPMGDALLSHLAARIHRAVDASVELPDLALLLERGPWLLVLDGLDEVPGASGRSHTLAAIQAFVQRFAAASNQIVATTRPQGYTGEFEDYQPRRLAPLSLHRALWYAQDLVRSWFPDERATRQRVLDRLLQAARDDSTARLMQSPLQTTIMAALLHRIARAPHERWRLYKDYFNTIYDRELGRRSDAAELLRAQRPHIEAIHAQAALHLQVACETEGSTAALLSRDALLAILHARLATQHTDETRRRELAQAILNVAEQRLVFLVSPREGFYGFELRSLQEFMAAEALMNGREQTVEGSIRRISSVASWRNVLLFAISRCFSTSSPLTETFTVDLCDHLDNDPNDPAAAVLHPGTQLALDILQEGSALYYPAITLRLLTRVLSRMPDVDVPRVAIILEKLKAEPDLAPGTAQILIQTLTPHLMTPDDQPRAVWGLINATCDLGLEGAEQLAAAVWTAALKPRKRAIVRIFNNGLMGVCSRLVRIIADDLAILDPWDISRLRPTPRARELEPDAVARLKVVNRCVGLHQRITVHGPLSFEFSAYFLDPWRTPAPLQVPASDTWETFAHVVQFVEAPDPKTLAAAIRAVHAAGDLNWDVWRYTPWPLAAALATESRDELLQIASLAEQGSLGDRSIWLAAQARWAAQGLSLEELVRSEPPRLPLPSYYEVEAPRTRPDSGEALASLYRQAGSPAFKRLLRALFGATQVVLPEPTASSVLLDLLNDAEVSFFVDIHGALERLSDDDFVAALDHRGSLQRSNILTGEWNSADDALTSRLAACLQKEPQRSGLRRILTSLAIPHAEPSREVVEALSTPAPDDPPSRIASFLWRFARASLSNDHEPWIQEIVDLAKILDTAFLNDVFTIINQQPRELAEFLLVSLLKRFVSPRRGIFDSLAMRLHELRGKHRSGFHDPEIWRSLRLPEPPPPGPEALELADSNDGTTTWYLDSLLLTNIRAFERFELRAIPPENGHGQWIVLVGENGVGKTTALRAITLALTTHANAGNALSRLPAPMRRSARARASIQVTSRGHRHSVAVTSDKDDEIIAPGDGDPPQRPFLLVAYGCRRGSAIGGPDRALLTEPIHDIHTLFDDTESGLNHAERWMQKLDHHALEDSTGAARRVLETVKTVLIGILPGVDHIAIDSREVFLGGPQIGRTRLAGLSDGYVTTLGWICDLMARWIHKMELRRHPIPERFHEHMTGLVLIDEIDLHLHPRWQLRVLDDVRAIFPRMSFVVTTHNPLTLLGARPGELHVLRAGTQPGVVEALQLDVLPGLRADQVLTGVWFGVTSTVDPDTIRLMQEHRAKIRGGAQPGDASVAALEAEIRKRLQLLGPTPLEQVTTWNDGAPARTPEQEASIRRELRDQWIKRPRRRS